MADKYIKRLSLFELIPKQELKFPSSNKVVLGLEERDKVIADAMSRAVQFGNPSRYDGAQLLIELFAQVVNNQPKRLHGSRDMFWLDVTEAWDRRSGVSLGAYDVRDLVLAITRAERMWPGKRAPEPTDFLRVVRMANDYFRQHEPGSDEAMEFLAEVRASRTAPHVFWRPPTQRIPWTDLSLPGPPSSPGVIQAVPLQHREREANTWPPSLLVKNSMGLSVRRKKNDNKCLSGQERVGEELEEEHNAQVSNGSSLATSHPNSDGFSKSARKRRNQKLARDMAAAVDGGDAEDVEMVYFLAGSGRLMEDGIMNEGDSGNFVNIDPEVV